MPERRRPVRGVTLIELLAVLAIAGTLIAIAVPVTRAARRGAQTAQSSSNIRQLAIANLGYAVDNGGRFAPATDAGNLRRWHGSRTSVSKPFEGRGGFLAPYLGESGMVQRCPVFDREVLSRTSFEQGSGGYGYNALYIGANPRGGPEYVNRIPRPDRTVMFATTALARAEGLQEYPFAEPLRAPNPDGTLGLELQPSVHFRHGGRALVAWCDAHVTAEAPNTATGPNYYGGDNRAAAIGWFGPTDDNGYWNPRRAAP